jgi:hypothetical protein
MVKDNILLTIFLSFILLLTVPVYGDSNNDTNSQTNQSGSNTQITGGYTSTTTNSYSGGQTNTTTNTTTSTTNGSDIPVNSSSAPSYSAMSQDVCSMGISGGVSTMGFGLSGGKHFRDLNCERIKLSKVLFDYGMRIAAVSLLCQDERVFEAMQMAGTPCPFEGKIGPDALAEWTKYDVERPDYETYIEKLETRSQIDAELEAIRIEEEKKELARKLEEEKKKLATLLEQEEVDKIIIETDLETKENKIINVHN